MFFVLLRSKANLSKNRYTDVLCLDETRVKLIPILGDPSSDYINANFVDGYKRKSAYISTQGKHLSHCLNLSGKAIRIEHLVFFINKNFPKSLVNSDVNVFVIS